MPECWITSPKRISVVNLEWWIVFTGNDYCRPLKIKDERIERQLGCFICAYFIPAEQVCNMAFRV